MLRNPFYTGKVLLLAYKDEPEEIIKGQHEPLVSDRLFWEVLEVLEGRKRRYLSANRCQKDKLMLRGVLTCGKCGRRLTGSASKEKLGVKYVYYHCKFEWKERFRADVTHDTLLNILSSVSTNEKMLQYLEAVNKDSYRRDDKDHLADLTKVNKELQTLQTRLSNAQTMMLDGAFDTAE